MMQPIVTVIVPTHKRPEMLAEALASVREQTRTDIEVVVISNGESRAESALSRAVASRYGAHFCEVEEGNVSGARNLGNKFAHGTWVAFLDDDDIWHPEKLETQLAAAAATGAAMVVCHYRELFPDGNVRAPPDNGFPKGWSIQEAITHQKWNALPSNVLVLKSVMDDVGGFDPRLKANEDLDLWRRISWRYKVRRIPDILTDRRMGHASISTQSWLCKKHEFLHCLKMSRDTPADMRWSLPWMPLWRPLLKIVLPWWVRHPRKAYHTWQRPIRAGTHAKQNARVVERM